MTYSDTQQRRAERSFVFIIVRFILEVITQILGYLNLVIDRYSEPEELEADNTV